MNVILNGLSFLDLQERYVVFKRKCWKIPEQTDVYLHVIFFEMHERRTLTNQELNMLIQVTSSNVSSHRNSSKPANGQQNYLILRNTYKYYKARKFPWKMFVAKSFSLSWNKPLLNFLWKFWSMVKPRRICLDMFRNFVKPSNNTVKMVRNIW